MVSAINPHFYIAIENGLFILQWLFSREISGFPSTTWSSSGTGTTKATVAMRHNGPQ
jgi:hypothetical protein